MAAHAHTADAMATPDPSRVPPTAEHTHTADAAAIMAAIDAMVGLDASASQRSHGNGRHGNGRHGNGRHGNGRHGNARRSDRDRDAKKVANSRLARQFNTLYEAARVKIIKHLLQNETSLTDARNKKLLTFLLYLSETRHPNNLKRAWYRRHLGEMRDIVLLDAAPDSDDEGDDSLVPDCPDPPPPVRPIPPAPPMRPIPPAPVVLAGEEVFVSTAPARQVMPALPTLPALPTPTYEDYYDLNAGVLADEMTFGDMVTADETDGPDGAYAEFCALINEPV
jgi:hypothetical protein